MNKKIVRRHFSLIELLIVIGIMGALAAIIIPTFTNQEKEAKTAVSNVNANGLMRYILMFRDANGSLPSGFHTGLAGATSENTEGGILPEGIADATGLEVTPMKNDYVAPGNPETPGTGCNALLSLNRAGIRYLASGAIDSATMTPIINADENEGGTVTNVTVLRVAKTNGANGLATITNTKLNEQKFDGKTLAQWLKPDGFEMDEHADNGEIILLFVTPNVDWTTVYKSGYHGHDDHGHFELRLPSKVSIKSAPVNVASDNEQFKYYGALFKIMNDGSPAQFIGLIDTDLNAI